VSVLKAAGEQREKEELSLEAVLTPELRGSYMKTYAVDVNASRAPEEGAHSPSWQTGLLSSSSSLEEGSE
jgi:hypothetical protein